MATRQPWRASCLSALAVLAAAVPMFGQEIGFSSRLVQAPAEGQPLMVEVRLDIPDGYYVYSSADHFFRLQAADRLNLAAPAIELAAVVRIPDLLAERPGATTAAFRGAPVFRLSSEAAGASGEPWKFAGEIRYQACSDRLCLPPATRVFEYAGTIGQATADERPAPSAGTADTGAIPDDNGDWRALASEFQVTSRLVGYAFPERFAAFVDAGMAAAAGRVGQGGRAWLEQRALSSPLFWVIAVLLGGLALNLTPCVLPMIPVTLAVIGAGARAQSRVRGLALGAAYAAGVALAYGIPGLAVVLTGATFGAINASPWFNLGLAAVFLVLASAMAGWFNLDFSALGSRLNTGRWRQGSYLLAFILGGIAALAAGACVAPVVVFVLVQSAQQYAAGNPWSLLYPFVLGIGMALPWPLAGAGLTFLPRPGRWMNAVKYIFAGFIALLALYYAQLGIRQLRPPTAPTPAAAAVADGELQWHTDLAAALATAARTGQPLLIDFWASWCKNCHAMDRTTLRHRRVRKALEPLVLLKFQAEDSADPATAAVLAYFEVIGLPAYVILRPQPGGE